LRSSIPSGSPRTSPRWRASRPTRASTCPPRTSRGRSASPASSRSATGTCGRPASWARGSASRAISFLADGRVLVELEDPGLPVAGDIEELLGPFDGLGPRSRLDDREAADDLLGLG